MAKPTRRLTGILLGLLVVPVFVAWNWPAGGTVPHQGPSLFIRPAHAMAFGGNWGKGEATPLAFAEMYSGASPLGLEFSPKIKKLNGQRVTMTGFMAPPLKPTLAFFVLTKVPMAICPFCSTDADWPEDIVLVRLDKPATALPFDQPLRIAGRLEIGSQIDETTGFVSLVRIYADTVERAR